MLIIQMPKNALKVRCTQGLTQKIDNEMNIQSKSKHLCNIIKLYNHKLTIKESSSSLTIYKLLLIVVSYECYK